MSGQKIIDGLKDAVAGNFERVTIDGQVWVKRDAEIERLKTVLQPFAEIARRLEWDKIADDDMALGDHIIDAPADDIAPGAAYCLMIGAFREAARAVSDKRHVTKR